MAGRTSILAQQTQVNALPAAPHVSADDALARGLGAAGNVLNDIQQRQDRDAELQARVALSQAHLDAATMMDKLREETPENPDGFAPAYIKRFDEYADKTISNFSNPVARNVLTAGLASARAQYGQQAIQWQAAQNVKFRGDQVDKIVDNYSQVLSKDYEPYDAVLSGVHEAIDGMNLPAEFKAKFRDTATARLTEAAGIGFAVKFPWLAQKLVNRKFGITEPSTEEPGGTPAMPKPDAPMGDFNAAVTRVLGVEGGYVENDAGAGPTNFGINSTANPGVDVKSLTRDGAIGIYREKYWNAIGADNLPRDVAMVAFDAAVNQGPEYAKKLIADSGGDVRAMIEMRRQRYEQIAANDPAKARYLAGWNARLDSLAAELAPPRTPTQIAAAMSETLTDVDPPVLPGPDMSVSVEKSIGAPWLDRMDSKQLYSYKTMVDGLVQKDQAQAQARIRLTMSDAALAAEQGRTPPIPSRQEFRLAYGEQAGDLHYREAETIRDTGTTIGTLRTMEPDRMQAEHAKARAALTTPGMQPGDLAIATKRLSVIENAITTLQKARQADPIVAAGDQNIAAVKPIDWSKPDEAAAELRNRQGVALTMFNRFRVGDGSALTKPEASGYAEAWPKWTDQQQLEMIGALRANLSDDTVFRATLKAIKPDDPTLAIAGGLHTIWPGFRAADGVSTPDQVAMMVLQGTRLLNPTKAEKSQDGQGKPFQLPPAGGATGMDKAIADRIGAAFADNPERWHEATQAVKAYYAAAASKAGKFDGELDTSLLNTAVDNVIGKATTWHQQTTVGLGGGKLVLPWGWDEQAWQQSMDAGYAKAMASAGYLGGPFDQPDSIRLIQRGPTSYLMQLGAGTITGRDGRPLVLDITPGGATPVLDATAAGIVRAIPAEQRGRAKGTREASGAIR